MHSLPAIRKLLFYLSLFYGLQADFVSESSDVQINLDQQTFTILLNDLQIPENQEEFAVEDFAKMDTAENRLARTPEFDLDTFHLFEAAGQLNAQLKFTFSSHESLFKVLNIQEDRQGYMAFSPMQREKIRDTNGELESDNGGAAVRWAPGTEVLKLSLTRLPGKEPSDSTRSLLPAWNKWKNY